MVANLTTKLGQLVDVLTPDTTNTRIGIGTTSPAVSLDVYSASDVTIEQVFSGGTASRVFPFKWGRANGGVYGYLGQDCSVDNAVIVGTGGNFPLAFYQNGLERARINASGLGIGMTPTNILDITQNQNADSFASIFNNSSGAAARVGWKLNNNTSQGYLYYTGASYTPSGMVLADGLMLQGGGAGGVTIRTTAAQPIYFGINSAEAARFNTSSHLCVGTTTDMGHLNVGGAVSCFSGGTANLASNISMDFSGGGGRIQGYGADASTNGTITFTTVRSNGSNPLSMTLDTSGNLLVNKTTSLAGNAKFQVTGSDANYTSVINDGTATNGCQLIRFDSAGGGIGAITNASNVAVAYNTTSDKNLKTLVGTRDNGNLFDLVEWNEFTWIKAPQIGVQVGVFAQDIQKLIPNVVAEGRGVLGDEDYEAWQVNYTGLVPYLGAEVKSLRARVATLEARLTALETK